MNLSRVMLAGQGCSFRIEGETLVLENLPEGTAPFELEIFTTCYPEKNSKLMGLFLSGGDFFTQCEAEGFRRITYFLDRPDVMASYTVTLRADKARYPVLLSNGNLTDAGDLPEGRHFATWHDPHKKPSYLFALVAGKLVKSQGQGQSYEIQASGIEVTGWVEDPLTYPMQPKQHSLEYLREFAHLRPRTNLFGAVTRIRHCLSMAVHRFFHERGFYWISTPIITTSDAEGAGQMFRVSTLDVANLPRDGKGNVDFSRDFFGKETFLTVSGQLNVEAYCLALSKVYTFGPTFRAENSNTTRHLAEFWMIEPEIAFADLNDDANLAEDFLKYLFRAVLDERGDDLAFIAERVDKTAITRLESFINAPFERIDYSDAITLLQKSGKKFDFPVEWGLDLQTEHERWLTEEHVGRPVVVMN